MSKRIVAVPILAGLAIMFSPIQASADPVSAASCNGVFSVMDAHNQLRDDVAHIFKEIGDANGFPPGFIPKETPHPCT
jgi:hypothetical protein